MGIQGLSSERDREKANCSSFVPSGKHKTKPPVGFLSKPEEKLP